MLLDVQRNFVETERHGKFFLLLNQNRACSKMKSAQRGFSFTKSNIHFLKQLCLYFNYMTLTVLKKIDLPV